MKTFSTEYTAKNLTKNAGLVNLGKFADKAIRSCLGYWIGD